MRKKIDRFWSMDTHKSFNQSHSTHGFSLIRQLAHVWIRFINRPAKISDTWPKRNIVLVQEQINKSQNINYSKSEQTGRSTKRIKRHYEECNFWQHPSFSIKYRSFIKTEGKIPVGHHFRSLNIHEQLDNRRSI